VLETAKKYIEELGIKDLLQATKNSFGDFDNVEERIYQMKVLSVTKTKQLQMLCRGVAIHAE